MPNRMSNCWSTLLFGAFDFLLSETIILLTWRHARQENLISIFIEHRRIFHVRSFFSKRCITHSTPIKLIKHTTDSITRDLRRIIDRIASPYMDIANCIILRTLCGIRNCAIAHFQTYGPQRFAYRTTHTKNTIDLMMRKNQIFTECDTRNMSINIVTMQSARQNWHVRKRLYFFFHASRLRVYICVGSCSDWIILKKRCVPFEFRKRQYQKPMLFELRTRNSLRERVDVSRRALWMSKYANDSAKLWNTEYRAHF